MPTTTDRVVADLVSAGLLDPARTAAAESVVSTALAEPAGRRPAGTRALLVEIAGYVGGALVVAAVGLFLAREWNDLSEQAQVLALAAVTLVLVAAGLLVARIGGGYAEMRAGDEVRRRLASALLAAGAVAAGLTVAQQADHLRDGWSDWPSLLGGVTTVVLAAAAYAVAPSVLGQLVTAGAAVQTVSTSWVLADPRGSSTVGVGLTLLAVGVVWLAAGESGVLRERTAGRVVGAAFVLVGAQLPVFDGDSAAVAYGLLAAAGVAGFVLYVRTVAWPYLVAGVLATTLVVPEAVIDWTDGSLGVAGGVLVAGLTLLAASLTGLRVRQEAGD